MDKRNKPEKLPFHLLEDMTNGFSKEQKVGSGGYGEVYKGVRKNGEEIAIKKLYEMPGLNDDNFQNELENLVSLKHPNIVQFVGYCYEIRHEYIEHKGKLVLAQQIDRALCFEYLPNGSLQKHLDDEYNGLDWHTRYKIIKGTCKGLEYLHEGLAHPIYHLDLKPDNILLDKYMVPKISDFGLSRIFGEEQTCIVNTSMGTIGYLPPEYIQRHVISKKFDIFSLGVVIIKIMAGSTGYSKISEMASEEFIDVVHGNWKNRLQAESMHLSELYGNQVKTCIEIAVQCMEEDRHKRPSIGDIIRQLDDTERPLIQKLSTQLLDIYPSQLLFPFEPNKLIPCLLYLTNTTDDCVTFELEPNHPERYLDGECLWGSIPPRSTYTLIVTAKEQQEPPQEIDKFVIKSIIQSNDSKKFHEVTLMSAYDPPGKAASKVGAMIISDQGNYEIIDVHEKDNWILTNLQEAYVGIFNYETQEIVNSFEVVDTTHDERYGSGCVVLTCRFIARKHWFVAGCRCGLISVYSWKTMTKVKSFKGHGTSVCSLAVHPTAPYVLSASDLEGQVKLWDWENDWDCIRIFDENDAFSKLVLNPNDTNIFAIQSYENEIKIYHVESSVSISSLLVTLSDKDRLAGSSRDELVTCFDYVTSGGEQYLATGCLSDYTVKIWDLQSKKCIKILEGHVDLVNAVCSHPDFPLLITGSVDGTVRIWNSINFRTERVLKCFGLGEINEIACVKGSRRLVIGHSKGLAIVEVENVEGTFNMGLSCSRLPENEN